MHEKFRLGILNRRDHLGDRGVNERILLIWMLKNCVKMCGIDSFGLECGSMKKRKMLWP
jgi:hypothetical protein